MEESKQTRCVFLHKKAILYQKERPLYSYKRCYYIVSKIHYPLPNMMDNENKQFLF